MQFARGAFDGILDGDDRDNKRDQPDNFDRGGVPARRFDQRMCCSLTAADVFLQRVDTAAGDR